MFCFAGAFSVNKSYFDVLVALVFCAVAWLLRKIDFPAVPILLGLVLGKMAETNFRRALMVSRGSYSIFVSSPFWHRVPCADRAGHRLCGIQQDESEEKEKWLIARISSFTLRISSAPIPAAVMARSWISRRALTRWRAKA